MNMYASAAPILTKNARRSVAYHPSVWGDHFLLTLAGISGAEVEEHERHKEKVKNLIEQTPDDSKYKIQVIDAIQRLGVAYHFEKEIDKSLKCIHDTHLIFQDDELNVAALRFRLLRQHGYHVPSEIFRKFIDDEGNFEINDVEGMLRLYEASNYGVEGEEILDKALHFTSSHLQSLLLTLTNPLTTRVVQEALKSPISKSLNRLVATKFISTYQQDESHNQILLNFAKLDFNIVQNMYKKELRDITRWWKDLDFANKLPFARDRVVECYFWIVGVYFEPHYSVVRKILTKVIYMAAVLDDIYDVHGTLDELQLFTEVLCRWDIEAVDELPEYMRIFYKALLDVYVEMEDMVHAGEVYRVQYAKQEMKKLAISYFEEAKWNYSKYMPTMEEYMKVALASCGYMMMTITSLVGIKQVTKEDFDWHLNEPLIIRASLTVCRLMDDLVGYKSEQKISAMHCYMNQNGCSETEAFRELGGQVKSAWKDINKEVLEPRAASMPVITPQKKVELKRKLERKLTRKSIVSRKFTRKVIPRENWRRQRFIEERGEEILLTRKTFPRLIGVSVTRNNFLGKNGRGKNSSVKADEIEPGIASCGTTWPRKIFLVIS